MLIAEIVSLVMSIGFFIASVSLFLIEGLLNLKWRNYNLVYKIGISCGILSLIMFAISTIILFILIYLKL